MAKLSSNGVELLRVQRMLPASDAFEHAKQLAYFAKGNILMKSGYRAMGAASWIWSKWKHMRDKDGKAVRRDIGLDLIADVRQQHLEDGWEVVFDGAKGWA